MARIRKAASPQGSATSPIRTLVDDLRSRTDTELRSLLLVRPDLARPAPADLTALAARATTRASVSRAVEDLDLGLLRLAQACVIASEGRSPLIGKGELTAPAAAPLDGATVAGLLGRNPGDLVPDLTQLWDRALLWRDDAGWQVVPMLTEVMGPHPAGLGLRAAEVPDRYAAHTPPRGSDLRDQLDSAPAAARALLDTMVWGPPTAAIPASGDVKAAASWLIDHGLGMPSGLGHVALVREVALELRSGVIHRDAIMARPRPAGTPLDAATVDRVAGVHARQLLDWVDDLAQEWIRHSPRVLRSGGVGVRDLAALAKVLDVTAQTAVFVAELAYAADLVASDGDVIPVWVPTTAYESWAADSPAQRWAALGRAWRDSPRAAYLVGTTIRKSQTIGALTPEVVYPLARQTRRDALRVLAAEPHGTPVTDTELVALTRWRRPLRDPRHLDAAVRATVQEAELLGVMGLGALTAAGRALVAGAREDEIIVAAEAALPAPVDHVMLQGDLTVIAPGPLHGPLDRFIRLACDIESRGSATVFRASAASIRRALDTGLTADELLGQFAEASRTPVPQPLDYLVRDVARRHGQARVGGATAYLRCDDEAVLVAILADRGLAPAMLRRIAPTVLVSRAEPTTLLDLLREHGYAPAQEGFDGSLIVAQPAARLARSRRRTAGEPSPGEVDEAFAAAVVAQVRAAPARPVPLWSGPRSGPTLSTSPTDTAKVLRQALADSRTLWLGYADSNGRTGRHLVRPVRLEGGRLYAVSGESATEQLFVVHRITGVAMA